MIMRLRAQPPKNVGKKNHKRKFKVKRIAVEFIIYLRVH